MNEERQKYVEDMLDMFQHEGWKWLVADLAHTESLYSTVDGCSTLNDLQFAKGVLWATRNIIRLPDEMRDAAEEGDDDA
jgi:hypothetical protein